MTITFLIPILVFWMVASLFGKTKPDNHSQKNLIGFLTKLTIAGCEITHLKQKYGAIREKLENEKVL